jgi:hypothetical protein
MYQVETSGDLLKNKRKLLGPAVSWTTIGPTVFLLGITSLLTDISAEMVRTVLPLYLLVTLRFSPFQVSVSDGIYQGATVLVGVASGFAADRWRRSKQVAAAGYGLSAVCKLGFLAVSSWPATSAVILSDRIGKGIRTAPRDAMIAASSGTEQRATAFGVHRAMDTAGAMIGPLIRRRHSQRGPARIRCDLRRQPLRCLNGAGRDRLSRGQPCRRSAWRQPTARDAFGIGRRSDGVLAKHGGTAVRS